MGCHLPWCPRGTATPDPHKPEQSPITWAVGKRGDCACDQEWPLKEHPPGLFGSSWSRAGGSWRGAELGAAL